MNFLRHNLMAQAVDIFAPPASGSDVTALNTGQTTQDGKIAALEAANTANPPHPHTNKSTLDAITGHGSIALAGRNLTMTDAAGAAGTAVDLGSGSATWNATTGVLTINHVDGTSTVANIGVPKVLHDTNPIAYNDATDILTLTFADNSTVDASLADLFDATAFSAVTKNDGTRTITYTRLDGSTVALDLSTWVPAVLTQAQAIAPADTTEGTVTGERLDQAFQAKHEMKIATAGQALTWGVRWILNSAHSYTFPTPTGAATDWMECFPDPAGGDWQSYQPATRWSAPGASTIGAGQLNGIQSNWGALTFHGVSAANIAVYG